MKPPPVDLVTESTVRRAVAAAIADGRLVPQPCVVCGDTPGLAHHRNGYADPLDVVWLCHRHHGAEHGRGAYGPTSWHDFRIAAGLTISELAAKSGIPRSVVGLIDQGRFNATPREALALLRILPVEEATRQPLEARE